MGQIFPQHVSSKPSNKTQTSLRPFSETHLLNMAVCLHSEVMHFGGCSDLMVLDSCSTVMDENPGVRTHTSQKEKEWFSRGGATHLP